MSQLISQLPMSESPAVCCNDIRPKKQIDMFAPLRVAQKNLTRAAGIAFLLCFFIRKTYTIYIEQGTQTPPISLVNHFQKNTTF